MTCEACTTSAERVFHEFRQGCMDCCARAIARGHHFFRVRQAGQQDRQYRALLQQFGATHEQVKAAYAADAMSKEEHG